MARGQDEANQSPKSSSGDEGSHAHPPGWWPDEETYELKEMELSELRRLA